MAAIERDGDGRNDLIGNLRGTADFAAGTLDAALDLYDAGDKSAWGRVEGRDLRIDGTGFKGAVTSDRGHAGAAEGSFFGHAGEEVAGAFRLDGPTTVAGGFAGRGPYDTGTDEDPNLFFDPDRTID